MSLYKPIDQRIRSEQTGQTYPAVRPADILEVEQFASAFDRPPGKVCLLYGDDSVFLVSLLMAAQAMARGASLAVVDGCNQFNVHLLSRFARERGINPDDFLQRIFISRGFTCYQMEAAITQKLPAFLQKSNSGSALIFGLLDTFYDEQAPLREVRQILGRLFVIFRELKLNGVSLLLTCFDRTVQPKERNQLFAALKQGMDRVYRLRVDESGNPRLVPEQHPTPMLPGGKRSHGPHRADIYRPHR
jgi:hypothetical protein